MCRSILGSILGCLAISPKASRRSLALRVPLALVIQQQRPSRPQRCESGELIKIVAATEVRARQTEARFNKVDVMAGPDAERWRKGAEASGQKKSGQKKE